MPILLSGLLDWVTWGWPFHAYFTYVYDLSVGGVAAAFGRNPFYSFFGWEWVAWGVFGIVIVVCTIYGGLRLPFLLLIVVTIFVLHSAIGHKEYRYISPALPVLMTLAGIGSVLAAEQSGGETRPACGPARADGRGAARLDRRLDRPRSVAGPDLVLGPLPRLHSGAPRSSTPTRKPAASQFIPAIYGGGSATT